MSKGFLLMATRKINYIFFGFIVVYVVVYVVFIANINIYLKQYFGRDDSCGEDESEGRRQLLSREVYERGFRFACPQLCPVRVADGLRLLVIAVSAPRHRDIRMAIRCTWGSFRRLRGVSIGFLVGAALDARSQAALDEEMRHFQDVIQANVVDSYENLTLKSMALLEWVQTRCSSTKFVLKVDDDVFLNIPRLLSFIESHANATRTIFGKIAQKWIPGRDRFSKYYVSCEQYRPSLFPNFTTGPAYLLTGDVVHDLYVASLDTAYLKLEDVFITGIVAEQINATRTHVEEMYNIRLGVFSSKVLRLISIHTVRYMDLFEWWKRYLDATYYWKTHNETNEEITHQ